MNILDFMLDLLNDLLANPTQYLRTETGSDFEDRIENRLRQRYSKILKGDISKGDFRLLKDTISKKEEVEFIKFSDNKNTFIKTPFGSQDYPDFLLFSGHNAIPIEIKFSQSASKPMWNSGLPRPNGIYIFGSHGQKDITFFVGNMVLSENRRRALIGFFEKVKIEEENFRTNLEATMPDEEKRGFTVYARRAYEQQTNGKGHINFFTHPLRKTIEKETTDTVRRLL